ncbi:unnamed protein product, partial [Ectocarpus sp. 8 AP-2014]
NIRPIQEVLRLAGRNSIPKGVQILLALSSRRRRGSSSTIGGEAVISDVTQNPSQHGRESYVDSNRLAGIMNYLPLREAFGEFCQKSLCSERRRGEGGTNTHEAMVNEYIKDGAPSEINISSTTKHDIMELAKIEAFASLDQDARKLIFVKAEREIRSMLEDNLMAKFLASTQYKRAVDGDGHGRV